MTPQYIHNTMDHSDFIACSFMENYIGHKRVEILIDLYLPSGPI